MMVWMGIYTQTFLPAGFGNQRKILDQSRMNAENLRVRLCAGSAGHWGPEVNVHAR
jgi:hypothetical protein